MNRFAILALGAAVLLGTTGMFLLRAQDDELDPLKVAPDTQKLIFENTFVRVSEERMPAGASTPLHRHHRGVVIAMADYETEQHLPDGRVVHSNRHTGDVNWQEEFTHEVKNVGTTPQWAIRIELK